MEASAPEHGEGRPVGGRAAPRRAGEGALGRVGPEFHAAVELIGKRWTGAILCVLLDRPHFFAELGQAIPGLSDRLLSARLRELEAEGVVIREVHQGIPPRVSYGLTAKGRELEPLLRELESWAIRWSHG